MIGQPPPVFDQRFADHSLMTTERLITFVLRSIHGPLSYLLSLFVQISERQCSK